VVPPLLVDVLSCLATLFKGTARKNLYFFHCGKYMIGGFKFMAEKINLLKKYNIFIA